MKKIIILVIVLSTFCVSCKKDKSPSTPGAISGPEKLCPGDSDITYSILPVESSTYYLWTVPEDSKIISGQGTTSIKIKFGKISGSICVRANNNKVVTDPSCMAVDQGGISNSWCREMDFKAGARTESVGFSIGNKGYIGTGMDNNGSQHKDFWEYDPVLNIWTQKADIGGVARFEAVGFAIGNKGYIGVGYLGTSYLKDFWEYNPLINQWSQKADFGGAARTFAFSFSIGNKGYVGAGSDGITSTLSDFYEYDPDNDLWTKKADAVPRNLAVGFSIGNKGYMGMGANAGVNYNDFMEFDPTDSSDGFDVNNNPIGKWTQKATFPGQSRYATIGFSIGDKGYIGLGFDGDIYYNDFFEYNPASNIWVQKSDFAGESRGYAVGFAIQKNAYVGIGNNIADGLLSNFWVYGQ